MGDIDLEMLLERDGLPFNANEVIFLKDRTIASTGVQILPSISPDRSPVSTSDRDCRFWSARMIFPAPEVGVHLFILFDLNDEGLHPPPPIVSENA